MDNNKKEDKDNSHIIFEIKNIILNIFHYFELVDLQKEKKFDNTHLLLKYISYYFSGFQCYIDLNMIENEKLKVESIAYINTYLIKINSKFLIKSQTTISDM